MSTLTLIRHGQANAFQRDSDQLSDLGKRQAEALAEYWLDNEDGFDEVHVGTLVRQRRTEQIVAEAFEEAGEEWPEAQVSADWNEYDAPGILGKLVPELAGRDPRYAELVKAFEAARGTPDQNKHFQKMFEIAISEWMESAVETPGVEPFSAFQERVYRAMDRITGDSASRRVAVFTSGGPIGLSVQRVLGAPPRAFAEVNWRVRNASLTDYLFSGKRISLDGFNAVPHLFNRQLISYR